MRKHTVNATIHYYPNIECIAKASVNIRSGSRIFFRVVMKDAESARKWIDRVYNEIPVKLFLHN